MAFLTVGAVTVLIQSRNTETSAPVLIGERVRSFNNTMRSTVRGQKNVWRCTTKPLTDAELAALRATYTLGVAVSVTGDLVDNVNTAVYVREQGVEYVKKGVGFLRALSLQLEQV